MTHGERRSASWTRVLSASAALFASIATGCATGAGAAAVDANVSTPVAEDGATKTHDGAADAHDGGGGIVIAFGSDGGDSGADGTPSTEGGTPSTEGGTPDSGHLEASVGCSIDGATYVSGAANPHDACQVCQTSVSTSAWTDLADGTSCGGVQQCAGGQCGTACVIGTATYASGAVNPANACQTCQPGMTTSAWTTLAEGTSCGAGVICNQGTCGAGCSIGGTIYPPGTVNASNPCEACTPSTSTSAWSQRADGTNCGSGESCSAGKCGTQCEIGGSTYPTGTANPGNACQTCAPGTSATAWTTSANGTSCGAGSVCEMGACTAGCSVGGTYYEAGQISPSNPCQVCTPSTSTSAFANVADGTTCLGTEGCISGQCVPKNPFDASSCDGPPITAAQFAALDMGQQYEDVGSYTISVQTCAGVGCTSWVNVTNVLYDTDNGAQAYDLTGFVQFSSLNAIAFQSDDPTNTTPAERGACGLANPINQPNNATDCYLGEFQTTAPVSSGGMTPQFSGLVTDQCLRLTATTSSGTQQFRWVLLSSY